MTTTRPTRRLGVTLIELMVVIGIMLFLAALAAYILPLLRQKNSTTKAAGQVQGYLSQAKQSAVRDRAARGVRLNVEPGTSYVKSLQYVEVPPPTKFAQRYGAPTVPQIVVRMPDRTSFDNYTCEIYNTQSTWDSVGASIGDFILVTNNNGSFLFEISVFESPAPTMAGNRTAVLRGRSGLKDFFIPDPPMPPPPPTRTSGPETNFQVIRRARPLVGEQAIAMPPGTAIDLRYCAVSKPVPHTTLPAPATHQYGQLSVPICLNSGYENGDTTLDILFSADGEMFGTVTDKFILCVRPDDDAKPGESTLVVIYARTGGIMLQPVNGNPSGAPTVPSQAFDDLYFFTQDGQGAGL